MTPWCKEQVPVEGNFGRLFDQLNVSVDLLSREFSTSLVMEVGVSKLRPSVLPCGRLVHSFSCVAACRSSSSSRCWKEVCSLGSSRGTFEPPPRG